MFGWCSGIRSFSWTQIIATRNCWPNWTRLLNQQLLVAELDLLATGLMLEPTGKRALAHQNKKTINLGPIKSGTLPFAKRFQQHRSCFMKLFSDSHSLIYIHLFAFSFTFSKAIPLKALSDRWRFERERIVNFAMWAIWGKWIQRMDRKWRKKMDRESLY